MKHISPLLFSFFLLLVNSSCKKAENKIYFEGGAAPSLSVSSTSTMLLTYPNRNNFAVKFSWTNPDYKFTTGISSQNVSYLLQVDTTGSNFTNPNRQEISIASDLNITYTVGELNTVLTKLNLQENIPHNVEFRIKAALVNNTVPLYSNVIKIVITPYLDVAVPLPPTGELYITGSAVPSDWTNSPPSSQKCTKVSNTEYYIIMSFVSGKQYKFLSTLGQWQPQYGGPGDSGGDIGYNMGLPGQTDPPAIPTPAVAGSYKVTLNFKTGKYTVEKQ